MSISKQVSLALIIGTLISGLLVMVGSKYENSSSSLAKSLYAMQTPGIYLALVTNGVHGGTQLQFQGIVLIVNAIAYALVMFVVLRVKRAFGSTDSSLGNRA